MLSLFFLFLFCHSEELEPINIIDSLLQDEFSDRISYAPLTVTQPTATQITSPQFEDLFQKTTSVQSRSQGSPTTSIRGSNQAGRVLFLLDNIPLNFLDGFGGSSLLVPEEILNRIHILEGPGSASYGAPAMAGSVHFIPEIKNTHHLRLGLSDSDKEPSVLKDNRGTAHNVSLSSPIIYSEKDKIQASGFFENDQGDFLFTNQQGHPERRQNNRQHNRRFTLYGQHQRKKWRWSEFALFSHLNKTTPGSVALPFVTQQRSDAGLASFSSKYQLSPQLLTHSRMSYTFLNSDYFDGTNTKSNSEKIWISQGFNWEFLPNTLSQTTVDWSQDNYQATFAGTRDFRFSNTQINQSFIIPIGYQFVAETHIQHLTRYEKTLYNINLQKQFGGGHVWATYAQGYRPPSLVDLYANFLTFVGNANLQTESSQQVEAGGALQGQNYLLKASVYSIQYKNLIQTASAGAGLFTKENVGEARSYGANTSLQIRWSQWNYFLSLSRLQTEDLTNSKPLKFSPQHQLFTGLDYTYKNLTGTLQQTWWDDFEDFNFGTGQDVTLDQWTSTDIILSWQAYQNCQWQFAIYNLWNKEREMTYSYPEPQRRFAVTLDYDF